MADEYTPSIWRKMKTLWGQKSESVTSDTSRTTRQSSTVRQTKPASDTVVKDVNAKMRNMVRGVAHFIDKLRDSEYEIKDLRRSYSLCQKEDHAVLEFCHHGMLEALNLIRKFTEASEAKINSLKEEKEELKQRVESLNDECDHLCDLVEGIMDISTLLVSSQPEDAGNNNVIMAKVVFGKISRWKNAMTRKVEFYKNEIQISRQTQTRRSRKREYNEEHLPDNNLSAKRRGKAENPLLPSDVSLEPTPPKRPCEQSLQTRSQTRSQTRCIDSRSKRVSDWLDELDEVTPDDSVSQVADRRLNVTMTSTVKNNIRICPDRRIAAPFVRRRRPAVLPPAPPNPAASRQSCLSSESSESAMTITEFLRRITGNNVLVNNFKG